jgi:hypothetical protein
MPHRQRGQPPAEIGYSGEPASLTSTVAGEADIAGPCAAPAARPGRAFDAATAGSAGGTEIAGHPAAQRAQRR